MGYFITIEGGDFTGKTSLVTPSIGEILKSSGIKTIVSREPGGTKEAEAIRNKIFSRLNAGATTVEILELFNEARKLHLDQVIIPFLGHDKKKEGVVILDRYLDSTRVYQGLEGGVPLEKIKEYDKLYAYNYYPDLTFILYFPEEKFSNIFRARKVYADSKNKDRDRTKWDSVSEEKHLTRQKYYLSLDTIAKKFNENREFTLIDASLKPTEVIKQIIDYLTTTLFEKQKDVIIDSFNTMKKNGYWNELEEAWNEQQQY